MFGKDMSCTAQVTQDDKLFLFRPTGIARADYRPLPEPVRVCVCQEGAATVCLQPAALIRKPCMQSSRR